MNGDQAGKGRVSGKLRLAAWACHASGLNRLFYFLNRGRKRIITYHNVLPDAHFRWEAARRSFSQRICLPEASCLSRIAIPLWDQLDRPAADNTDLR